MTTLKLVAMSVAQCLHNASDFFVHKSESIFWMCAIGGTLLFFLKVGLVLLSGLGAEGFDSDHADGHDFDVETDLDHHGALSSFKLLSLNSLSGFFMMFGWVGLTALKQFNLHPFLSSLCGVGAGFILLLLSGLLLKGALALVSPGTRFETSQCIGLTGSVYQKIPTGGIGKIQLLVQGVTREVLAKSNDGKEIASFAQIKVADVIDNEIVLVEKMM